MLTPFYIYSDGVLWRLVVGLPKYSRYAHRRREYRVSHTSQYGQLICKTHLCILHYIKFGLAVQTLLPKKNRVYLLRRSRKKVKKKKKTRRKYTSPSRRRNAVFLCRCRYPWICRQCWCLFVISADGVGVGIDSSGIDAVGGLVPPRAHRDPGRCKEGQ